MKQINRITLFLLFTFGINYSMVALFYLLGGKYEGIQGTLLAVVYMFVPMLSVLIIEKGIHKEKIRTTLKISFKINKWFFLAWLIMPIISFATLGISLLFPEVQYTPEMGGFIRRYEEILTPDQIEEVKNSLQLLPIHPIWLVLFQGLIAGATINAVAGFGEELGWRGFLLKSFKNKSFLKASLLIGFIWGIWHAPLILMGHNYPQHPVVGVFMMIIWCILLTPIFIYFVIKSQSVIAAAIMHGTLNATAGIAIMVVDGGNDLTIGMTGFAGFLALSLFLIGLFIYDRKIGRENMLGSKIGEHF